MALIILRAGVGTLWGLAGKMNLFASSGLANSLVDNPVNWKMVVLCSCFYLWVWGNRVDYCWYPALLVRCVFLLRWASGILDWPQMCCVAQDDLGLLIHSTSWVLRFQARTTVLVMCWGALITWGLVHAKLPLPIKPCYVYLFSKSKGKKFLM